ncbi:MAG: DUF6531 domain-containing protein, partial [Acidobacteriota bacterium]
DCDDTDPTRWDTDGDCIPDGVETANSLNPLSAADGTTDKDGDSLNNILEILYCGYIQIGDTDNDGMGDNTEVQQGRYVNSPNDPTGYLVSANLTVGDHVDVAGDRPSERYQMTIWDEALTNQVFLRHQPVTTFARPETRGYNQFRPNRWYGVRIDPLARECSGNAQDLDYTADIQCGTAYFTVEIDDPHTILGGHQDCDTNVFAYTARFRFLVDPAMMGVDLDGVNSDGTEVADADELSPGVALVNGWTKVRIQNPWPSGPPGGTFGTFTLSWADPANKWLKLNNQASPISVPCASSGWPTNLTATRSANWVDWADSVVVTLSHSMSATTDPVRVGLLGTTASLTMLAASDPLDATNWKLDGTVDNEAQSATNTLYVGQASNATAAVLLDLGWSPSDRNGNAMAFELRRTASQTLAAEWEPCQGLFVTGGVAAAWSAGSTNREFFANAWFDLDGDGLCGGAEDRRQLYVTVVDTPWLTLSNSVAGTGVQDTTWTNEAAGTNNILYLAETAGGNAQMTLKFNWLPASVSSNGFRWKIALTNGSATSQWLPTNAASFATNPVTTTWTNVPASGPTNRDFMVTGWFDANGNGSQDAGETHRQLFAKVLKVDIVQTNLTIKVATTNSLRLTADSESSATWTISPTVQDGASFIGANTGSVVQINGGNVMTQYTVKASADLFTNSFDTAVLRVYGVDPDPLNQAVTTSKDPINSVSGNCEVRETDLAIPCPGLDLVFARAYNSQVYPDAGPLGPRWTHSFNWRFEEDRTNYSYKGSAPAYWKVLSAGDGSLHWFKVTGPGTFEAPLEDDWTLSLSNNLYRVDVPGGVFYTFDAAGTLTGVSNLVGNVLTLSYTNTASITRLARVDHNNGQYLQFGYTNGLLSSVATPSNNLGVSFAYTNGDLSIRTRTASGVSRDVLYFYDGLTHSLTQRVNEAGDGYIYQYSVQTNGAGQYVSFANQMYMSGAVPYYKHDVIYSSLSSGQSRIQYTRGTVVQTNTFTFVTNTFRATGIGGPDPAVSQALAYDAALNITNQVATNATAGDYARTVTLFDGKHAVTNRTFGYCASPVNPWLFSWDASYKTLTSITDPESRRTGFEYNKALLSKARLYYTSSNSWDTTYGYTADGLLSGVTNANGHWVRNYFDSYGFRTSTVPQLGPTVVTRCDRLGFVTNVTLPGASGPRATALDVNALGWVSKITYPNGLFETRAFDSLGNLTNSVDTGGRTNLFSWLPTRKFSSSVRLLSDGTAVTNRVEYDQQFNSLVIRDAMDRKVESYALDIQDRPVTVTNLEGQTMRVV